jgi:hypothetical protein
MRQALPHALLSNSPHRTTNETSNLPNRHGFAEQFTICVFFAAGNFGQCLGQLCPSLIARNPCEIQLFRAVAKRELRVIPHYASPPCLPRFPWKQLWMSFRNQ